MYFRESTLSIRKGLRMKGFLFFLAVALAATACTLHAQGKRVVAGPRTTVDLTIYNQNLSLIREERTADIPNGLTRLVIPEIPASIDGTSLHISSLTEPLAGHEPPTE